MGNLSQPEVDHCRGGFIHESPVVGRSPPVILQAVRVAVDCPGDGGRVRDGQAAVADRNVEKCDADRDWSRLCDPCGATNFRQVHDSDIISGEPFSLTMS